VTIVADPDRSINLDADEVFIDLMECQEFNYDKEQQVFFDLMDCQEIDDTRQDNLVPDLINPDDVNEFWIPFHSGGVKKLTN
jgi:hypothetical protein